MVAAGISQKTSCRLADLAGGRLHRQRHWRHPIPLIVVCLDASLALREGDRGREVVSQMENSGQPSTIRISGVAVGLKFVRMSDMHARKKSRQPWRGERRVEEIAALSNVAMQNYMQFKHTKSRKSECNLLIVVKSNEGGTQPIWRKRR